jgi:hypothetical protein
VVREEVAADSDPRDLGVVAAPEKRNEQSKKVGIGVCKSNAIPVLVRLCPEEHAACEM